MFFTYFAVIFEVARLFEEKNIVWVFFGSYSLIFKGNMAFQDNQQGEKFFECSHALFTEKDNNKEKESFPECSQSILQNISKKVKFTSSFDSQDRNFNCDSDTSIDEITDSEEDECVKKKTKFGIIFSKDESKNTIKKKSGSDCCAAKKYFDALFSKNFNAELNTQHELPPIYAQFEHDLGIMLAFRLRNVPANKRLECYEKLINVVRQYEEKNKNMDC